MTAQDLSVAKGLRKKPPEYPDPALDALRERGFEHEKAFVERERGKGKEVLDLDREHGRVLKTIEAMQRGVDIIYQGELELDGWMGRADIIRKIVGKSDLGEWSYEVVDTKLARDTKGTTILQLALYSEIVGSIQGVAPEYFYVVTPLAEEPYRLNDYASYYHLVKRGLAASILKDPRAFLTESYPEPVEYCEMCRYQPECDKRRRADDHLSLVAGITKLQRRELDAKGVATLAALAVAPLDLAMERSSEESYVKVREQARIQLAGREKKANLHEMLEVTPGEGLTLLPAPSPHDIFLDLEGARYARDDGGREYLFGLVTLAADGTPQYHSFWATNDEEEKAAFEAAMDMILAARAADGAMHIYHYAAYEQTAFKRLMGRYATRQDDMDGLLRAGSFVDLHTVVKQSLRASVEGYSIKNLEVFYGFARTVELRLAGDRRAFIERCLERGAFDMITDEARNLVTGYNQDDCVSTLRLREWLEKLRADLVAKGETIERPTPKESEPPESVAEWAAKIAPLIEALTRDVPLETEQRSKEQQARWLLAHMLDYYRREDKVDWWKYFDMQGRTPEELEDQRGVVTGLQLVAALGKVGKARTRVTDRYRFPDGACRVRVGDELHDSAGRFGELVAIDADALTIDIIKAEKRTADLATSLFAHNYINPSPKPELLVLMAESVLATGMTGAGGYRVARSLLLHEPPRLSGVEFRTNENEAPDVFATRIVNHLDSTVLPIQGPPGTGKTYTGARMICELVRAGKKVGVTATGHTVIQNLLKAVLKQARKEGLTVSCATKVYKKSDDPGDIREFTGSNYDPVLNGMRGGAFDVLGGSSWLWAREDARDLVDVLVVDEAGQMTLADVVVSSQAAKSVVLLGDPQQLEQPQQGSHPEGTEASALAHILEGDPVITPERGIFLSETRRMAPAICDFCSEVFYEGKVTSHAGLEKQCITGTGRFDGAGLWLVPVTHEGNQHESPEEVAEVERIIATLTCAGAEWYDGHDDTVKPLTAKDILVVAAYNAQVDVLRECLGPLGVRAGTVDKFQGQEAAVVIYSMAASSPSDASRGMEFLYSLNRLNVATSRARCATIVVASPLLFEPECASPKRMRLASGLCRYVEMAKRV
jgi:uncharacterized protein